MDALSHKPRRPAAPQGDLVLGRLVPILLILLLPLLLGAWQDASGNTINPNYVKRIENGKTSKHEILLYFGDPKEIEKSDVGPVYKYFSYKDAPADFTPYQHEKRKIQEQSDSAVPDRREQADQEAPGEERGQNPAQHPDHSLQSRRGHGDEP